MNAKRKSQLTDISARLESIHSSLEQIAIEERMAYDRTPEQLRTDSAEDILWSIETAANLVDEAVGELKEIVIHHPNCTA